MILHSLDFYDYCSFIAFWFERFCNKIDTTATTTIKPTIPMMPKYFATLPSTTPTTKKSVSENVVAAPPKSLKWQE